MLILSASAHRCTPPVVRELPNWVFLRKIAKLRTQKALLFIYLIQGQDITAGMKDGQFPWRERKGQEEDLRRWDVWSHAPQIWGRAR